jgi:hypothetical protein
LPRNFIQAKRSQMPSQPNPEFLRRAIALATQNVVSGAGGPFGAVMAREGTIVGEGANSVRDAFRDWPSAGFHLLSNTKSPARMCAGGVAG